MEEFVGQFFSEIWAPRHLVVYRQTSELSPLLVGRATSSSGSAASANRFILSWQIAQSIPDLCHRMLCRVCKQH